MTTYYGWDSANAWRTCQGPTPAHPGELPDHLSYIALGGMSAFANSDTNTSAIYTYDASGQRTKSTVSVAGVTTTTTFRLQGLPPEAQRGPGRLLLRIDYLFDEEGALWGGVYRTLERHDLLHDHHADDRGDVSGSATPTAPPSPPIATTPGACPKAQARTRPGSGRGHVAGQLDPRRPDRQPPGPPLRVYAWDAESALYYCSARYYDPATRQWTTGDPAKADGEESAYQYWREWWRDRESGRFHVHVDVVPQTA